MLVQMFSMLYYIFQVFYWIIFIYYRIEANIEIWPMQSNLDIIFQL